MSEDKIIIVFTNVPDIDCANQIAETLIQSQLAACVNILSPCQSVYHWDNMLVKSSEIPMMIKTNQQSYPSLEASLLSMHPYELPEIIALNVNGGLPQYLQWVNAQITH